MLPATVRCGCGWMPDGSSQRAKSCHWTGLDRTGARRASAPPVWTQPDRQLVEPGVDQQWLRQTTDRQLRRETLAHAMPMPVEAVMPSHVMSCPRDAPPACLPLAVATCNCPFPPADVILSSCPRVPGSGASGVVRGIQMLIITRAGACPAARKRTPLACA